jgi:hypothetical protein
MEQVEGKLSSIAGEIFAVSLRLTTKSLFGESGFAVDEVVSEVALITSRVPDGEYVLEYFYSRPVREHVRVKYGVLLSR